MVHPKIGSVTIVPDYGAEYSSEFYGVAIDKHKNRATTSIHVSYRVHA
jgi:hypothetical protein